VTQSYGVSAIFFAMLAGPPADRPLGSNVAASLFYELLRMRHGRVTKG